MQIKSLLPFPADVVLLGREVQPGEVVDVSDEQAAALLAQVGNWIAADATVPATDPNQEVGNWIAADATVPATDPNQEVGNWVAADVPAADAPTTADPNQE